MKHAAYTKYIPSRSSHPAWVRGLKHTTTSSVDAYGMSHPAWVRGLKPGSGSRCLLWRWSHPAWVRGLKPKCLFIHHIPHGVAPRVGAWIETSGYITCRIRYTVAPRVGAWIETCRLLPYSQPCQSHPAWVRGLKPASGGTATLTVSRTPCGCVD